MSTPKTRRSKQQQPTPSSSTTQNGRLFTDADELSLLRTFHKITKSTPSSSSPITLDFQTFNSIDNTLTSKFTHPQITDKLRRLRIKYHKQARSKSLIKTPHDQKAFKIAQKIWGKKVKRKGGKNVEESQQPRDEEGGEADNAAVVEVERNGDGESEEVNLEDYPVLLSEFSKYLPMNLVWREALKSLGNGKLREMNEKWMLIGIEEAKIANKKAELVKEQTGLIMQVLGDARDGN